MARLTVKQVTELQGAHRIKTGASQFFVSILYTKIHKNPSVGDSFFHLSRWTDMTQLIASISFANMATRVGGVVV
jgi:hypothetical protein